MARTNQVWDDVDRLRTASECSSSIKEALSTLGLNANSGNYQTYKGRCLRYGIDPPRYNPENHLRVVRNRIPDSEYFTLGSSKRNGQQTLKRLVDLGILENVCSECGQNPWWNGKSLTLTLEHINGNMFDNRIENLTILCGHCHSQTETFGGKNVDKLPAYSYCKCGSRMWKNATQCRVCFDKELFKKTSIRYPSINELHSLYLSLGSFEGLARHLKVSSNAVRKYIRKSGIDLHNFTQGILD